MTNMSKLRSAAALFLFALIFCALPHLGHAAPFKFEMGFQEAATPVAERIFAFHHMLLYIITGIVIFVTALLLYIIVRFNARMNPVPSATSHNVMLEVAWTIVPVLILIVIAVPSFKLLYYADRTAKPDMTLKVTGFQWYWGYEYPDDGGISFNSNVVKDEDLKDGQVRLLSVDNPVVVPVDTNIQIITTGQDVIHSWAVPSFGVKLDAIPGRVNETWMRVTKPGTYYGQCDQLCGNGHGYMPIEIHAVSKEDFAAWVQSKGGQVKPKTAAADTAGAANAAPAAAAAQ